MQKIENHEFVQSTNLEFTQFFEHNGRKYLWVFDVSCEECHYSKFETAERHRGLSTTYNQNNLFH